MLTHSNNENKSNNGFVFGFILGVAAALLLNTKKGRKILKTFVDQGIDRISNWEDVVKKIIEEEDDFIENGDYISQPSSYETEISSEAKQEKIVGNSVNDNSSIAPPFESKVKTATRRFFKGIKRRG